jgi:hypothetical protein
MAKQPFTPTGVSAKLQELYALSDTNLSTQANLISSNFRGWMSDNFSLDTKQATYLAGIDTQFIDYAATVTATAVQSRLPVNLIYPGPPPNPVSSKYIVASDYLHPKYDSVAGYSVTGYVTFEIGYL